MRAPLHALAAVLAARVLAAGPSLVCEQPRHDFGPRVSTQSVCHTFLLKNTGNQPACVARVISGCSCLRASPEQARVEPGASLALDVCLDLGGRSGPQEKPVFVLWSPVPGVLPLRLSLAADAQAPVVVTPAALDFGAVAPTGEVARAVRIATPVLSQAFRVTGASCSDSRLTVCPPLAGSNHAHTVTVFLRAPLQPAAWTALLTVTTDHPCYPSLAVPVSAHVRAAP